VALADRGDFIGKGRAGEKLKRKVYEKHLDKLHAELVSLQECVKLKGLKVCIVFEGRNGKGKGGVIKAITERRPAAGEGEAAGAAEAGRIPGARLPLQVHPREVLSSQAAH